VCSSDLLPAWWVDSSEQQFSAKLKLSGIDQTGLVNQVTRVISNNMHADIFKINFDTDEGLFNGTINVRVKNSMILDKLVNNLLKINGIEKVTRE
jgi:GTP pyrophosphokinase